MSRKTIFVFLLFISLFLLSCRSGIVVLSYNVENLFDDRDDGREYPEYRGDKWTEQLYQRKLAAVARAVASAGGADILCLQEVESRVALQELRDRHLKASGYHYLVFVPQEGVATTVACLSRLPVLGTRVHAVGSFDGIPLRHILEIRVEHEGSTLYLFNNHWKSKSGGIERTAEARRLAAAVLTERIREILTADPEADLLVLGDLNENLDEHDRAGGRFPTATVSLAPVERLNPPAGTLDLHTLYVTPVHQQAGMRENRIVLYEPWFEIEPEARGTSVYQRRWQTPDRILLSPGLFDESGFLYLRGSFEVVKTGFLIDRESGYPRRWRSSAGGAESGTSDHLPLRLTIRPAPR